MWSADVGQPAHLSSLHTTVPSSAPSPLAATSMARQTHIVYYSERHVQRLFSRRRRAEQAAVSPHRTEVTTQAPPPLKQWGGGALFISRVCTLFSYLWQKQGRLLMFGFTFFNIYIVFPYLIPPNRCVHRVWKHTRVTHARTNSSSAQVTVSRHLCIYAVVQSQHQGDGPQHCIIQDLYSMRRRFSSFHKNVAALWTTFSHVTWEGSRGTR